MLRGHVPTTDCGAVRALATGALRLCHVITPDPRPNGPSGRSLLVTSYHTKSEDVVNYFLMQVSFRLEIALLDATSLLVGVIGYILLDPFGREVRRV